MSAASADRNALRQECDRKSHSMAAVHVYKGTLTCHNASGYLAPGAQTANFIFAGVALDGVDNSGGSAGDKTCRVEKYGEFDFVYNGGDATQALLGQVVYIVDDQTVDEDVSVTNPDIACGVITEVVSVTHVRVRIDGYAK